MDGSALAAAAVVAQLEGGALGGGAVGHVGVAATHLDLVQGSGALLAVVIGAAGHGAFDTGIGIHSVILLERENGWPEHPAASSICSPVENMRVIPPSFSLRSPSPAGG